jgi:hypothetical protein
MRYKIVVTRNNRRKVLGIMRTKAQAKTIISIIRNEGSSKNPRMIKIK